MAKRDFYEILGIAKGASPEEIRRAYRRLARRYHPDVNKEKDAQAKFTEIQEAYDTLSDEAKRKRYDRHGHAEPAAASSSARPHYSWTNVGGTGRAGGFDETELDPETLGSMFETFFGGRAQEMNMGAGRSRAERASARSRGGDAEASLEVPFMTAARGGTERFRAEIGGKSSTIDVKIPKGIADGAKLRIKGAGHPAPRGAGDLILTIRVAPHPLLRREPGGIDGSPLDLRIDLPLTIAEATLGAKVPVPTLQGEGELTVPPGTSSGQRFRLKGRGIEDESGRKGDLYAVVKVVTPNGAKLTAQEQASLRSIAGHTPDPRPRDQWRIE